MSSRRWGKFWWQDWQRDPALRMCSLAARGLWIDMLCVMNDADPQGHFLVNGKRPSEKQMAVIFSSNADEISVLLSELEDAGVFSKTEDGTIFSRRMVRDFEMTEKAKEWGKTGGNPDLNPKKKSKVKSKKKEGDNPTLNPPLNPKSQHGVNLHADISEAEAEAEADITLSLRSSEGAQNLKPEKSKRASRLPADWKPTPEQVQFAVDNQVDPVRTAEVFRDYWISVPGAKGRKADWNATWRNWVRREDGGSSKAAPSKAQQGSDNAKAWRSGVMLEGY